MPVTEHELREGTTQGQLSAPDFALSERDVRRKRPPLLTFRIEPFSGAQVRRAVRRNHPD